MKLVKILGAHHIYVTVVKALKKLFLKQLLATSNGVLHKHTIFCQSLGHYT